MSNQEKENVRVPTRQTVLLSYPCYFEITNQITLPFCQDKLHL